MLQVVPFYQREPAANPHYRLKYAVLLLVLLAFPLSLRAQRLQEAGGILTPAFQKVVPGNNSGTLVLGGFYGTILRYQADNGRGFVDVGGPGPGYMFSNLKKTTRFRAVVQTPSLVVVTSTIATVEVMLPDTATTKPVPPVVFENRQASFAPALALKLSPLAALDPGASALLGGIEYRISPRYGLEASFGQAFSGLCITTLGLTKNRFDYTYQKYKLELRRYLLPRTKNPNQEIYLSVQGAFMPQRYTRYGNNFYRDGRDISYDRAYVTKDVAGLNLKMGSMWHLWSSWLVEAGVGAGGRYVTTKYDMLNERRASNFTAQQSDPFNRIEEPGTKISIDMELVFKVGYVFPLHHTAPAPTH